MNRLEKFYHPNYKGDYPRTEFQTLTEKRSLFALKKNVDLLECHNKQAQNL